MSNASRKEILTYILNMFKIPYLITLEKEHPKLTGVCNTYRSYCNLLYCTTIKTVIMKVRIINMG